MNISATDLTLQGGILSQCYKRFTHLNVGLRALQLRFACSQDEVDKASYLASERDSFCLCFSTAVYLNLCPLIARIMCDVIIGYRSYENQTNMDQDFVFGQ